MIDTKIKSMIDRKLLWGVVDKNYDTIENAKKVPVQIPQT
eukprot:CAMPEP_0176355850 /NCGR_PEP_ID=MMETSP0126-20121128/13594_1 /TAXON_ID=141414 ORGANISM="Strombidinopsis acuminatum, Strain SPMC142" /NCGR_SAMPLE_ID=MMETSP0126 /ASSEMBLY_ACC=CAM_ASM_000229 /LENGTH=39 /DNA_ID= /DNA_START= /DNA_END= /DNA_ORIENTATION=